MGYLKSWISSHKYCYALLYLVFYMVFFSVLDHILMPKYIIHSSFDDLIPFSEYFVVLYLAWFPAMGLSLFLYMIYSKYDFQQLWFIMFTGMTLCLVIYAIFPNGLELREPLASDNIFCELVALIRDADTPANVCPSIHVATSTAIALVTARSKLLKGHRIRRAAIILLMILICISTLFVKQHSIVDVFWGAVLSLVLYLIAYRTNWRKIFCKTKLKFLV